VTTKRYSHPLSTSSQGAYAYSLNRYSFGYKFVKNLNRLPGRLPNPYRLPGPNCATRSTGIRNPYPASPKYCGRSFMYILTVPAFQHSISPSFGQKCSGKSLPCFQDKATSSLALLGLGLSGCSIFLRISGCISNSVQRTRPISSMMPLSKPSIFLHIRMRVLGFSRGDNGDILLHRYPEMQ